VREKPLILLVDDELTFLEIISTKLSASGFEVIVAHSAKEAIDAAGKTRPDLILMDISMPGETGTDAALAIKQSAATRDIKIAFLSNMKDPWPSTTGTPGAVAKALGMEEFVDKSADLDVITARVEEILASAA
jgi:CheY-like chemotaxis protein